MKIHRTDMHGSVHSRASLPSRLQIILSRLLGRELARPDWADNVDDRLDLLRRASIEERDGLVDEPLDALTMTDKAFAAASRPRDLPPVPRRTDTAALRRLIVLPVMFFAVIAQMCGFAPEAVFPIILAGYAVGYGSVGGATDAWRARGRPRDRQ